MRNYSEMSDLDINKLVATLILDDFWVDGNSVMQHDFEQSQITGYDEEIEFDPCNDPQDAWPIIVDNKISISWVVSYWQALSPLQRHVGGFQDENNPLRAAMIVYLMVKEKQE